MQFGALRSISTQTDPVSDEEELYEDDEDIYEELDLPE
jgi:hypothetical protein